MKFRVISNLIDNSLLQHKNIVETMLKNKGERNLVRNFMLQLHELKRFSNDKKEVFDWEYEQERVVSR